MNATTKKILAVALFLLAIGISVFVYISDQRSSVDTAVSDQSEEYTCPHCGHVFALTITEATEMRRSHGAIVCKKCGEKGPSKDVEFSIGGMGGGRKATDWGADDDDENDVVEVKQPRRTSGGMRKKDS